MKKIAIIIFALLFFSIPSTGQPDSLMSSENSKFVAALKNQLKKNWKSAKTDTDVTVEILFKISKNGRVFETRMKTPPSIKNQPFAEAALKTLRLIELDQPPPDFEYAELSARFVDSVNEPELSVQFSRVLTTRETKAGADDIAEAVNRVHKKLGPAWRKTNILGKGEEVWVSMTINTAGKIRSSQITRSSGNSMHDTAVMTWLASVSSLPQPQHEFEMQFVFPYNDRQ